MGSGTPVDKLLKAELKQVVIAQGPCRIVGGHGAVVKVGLGGAVRHPQLARHLAVVPQRAVETNV